MLRYNPNKIVKQNKKFNASADIAFWVYLCNSNVTMETLDISGFTQFQSLISRSINHFKTFEMMLRVIVYWNANNGQIM